MGVCGGGDVCGGCGGVCEWNEDKFTSLIFNISSDSLAQDCLWLFILLHDRARHEDCVFDMGL